jgi:hypothetical protein
MGDHGSDDVVVVNLLLVDVLLPISIATIAYICFEVVYRWS